MTPPPPGFILDQQDTPPLPDGFVLDGQPEEVPQVEMGSRPEGDPSPLERISQAAHSLTLPGAAQNAYGTVRSLMQREASPLANEGAQAGQQGAMFGLGDEYDGALRAVTQPLRNAAYGDEISMGEAYNQQASVSREQMDRSREDAPVTTFLLEMAGGGASGAGAARSFAQRFPGASRQIISFASRNPTIALALGGGATGAAVGAAENNDDRLGGAVAGGTLGAVLGPVVRMATGIGGRAYQRVIGGERSRLARTASRAGVTADDVSRMNGDFLAETAKNPRARSVAVGLAGEGDEAQAVIRDAVNDRQAGRAARLSDAVESATGSRGGASALLELDDIRTRARPLFNAADDMQGRMTPALRENIRAANRAGVSFRNADELAARNGDARVQLSQFADDADNLPNQIRLGDVRSLARAVENEARRLSRNGEDPGQLWNLAREMRDQIGRQSPQYREAASLWRSAARDEEAFELGQRAFRPGGQNERQLRRFFLNGERSQSEQRNFLAGVADAMDQRLAGAAETGNPAARLNRRIIRDRLRIVLGDDAGDELMTTIMRENRRAGFENTASREVNSATAARAEGREHARSAISGPARQVAGDLAEDVSGTVMARSRIANAVRGSDPEAARDLARLLVARSQDDPIVQQFLRELDAQYVTPVSPEMARIGGQGAALLTSQ